MQIFSPLLSPKYHTSLLHYQHQVLVNCMLVILRQNLMLHACSCVLHRPAPACQSKSNTLLVYLVIQSFTQKSKKIATEYCQSLQKCLYV